MGGRAAFGVGDVEAASVAFDVEGLEIPDAMLSQKPSSRLRNKYHDVKHKAKPTVTAQVYNGILSILERGCS
jgi:hypothetical protein